MFLKMEDFMIFVLLVCAMDALEVVSGEQRAQKSELSEILNNPKVISAYLFDR